jgi:hypothetical protein
MAFGSKEMKNWSAKSVVSVWLKNVIPLTEPSLLKIEKVYHLPAIG